MERIYLDPTWMNFVKLSMTLEEIMFLTVYLGNIREYKQEVFDG